MNDISRFTSVSLRLFIILALGAGMALGNVQPTKAEGVTINVPAQYATIQLAIDAASPGDTIQVAAGTYGGQITVNKSVTILGDPGDASPGPGSNAPVIDGGSLPGDAFLLANGVSNVTIQGFEIRNFTSPLMDGIGNGVSAWEASTSNITIQDNYFHHLGYNGVLVGNDGAIGDHMNWLIKGNVIENFGYIGFELTNTSNSSIEDNVIHLMTPYIGAIFSSARRSETGLTIRNNLIDGSPSTLYPVVYIYAYDLEVTAPNLDDVLIEGNTISTIGTPFQVYIRNIGTGTITGVQVHDNSLSTLKNTTSAPIDATDNWWGAATGPGTGAISGDVDYGPWYIDAGMTSLIPVHNVTQDTYYMTIQAAISAAASGDTISAAAGTYTETGQIVIDKNLSIVGADKATTIIQPGSNTAGDSGDAGAWILVNNGITFNLSKVTLDGAGRDIRQAIRYKGSGTVDDVIIQNMVYPGYLGWGIAQGYTSTTAMSLTVTNSTFTNFGRVGILIDEGSGPSTATISGNTFICKGTGDHLDYAIEVGGGAAATITNNTISNCRGVASVDGSTSAAIYVHTYFAPGTTASILDNTLTDSTVGIAVGYDDDDTAVVAAHGNRIFGNDFGVTTTSATVPVDATNNWWGDNDPSDNVSDGVDYTPWCENEDCNNPPPSLPSSFYGELHFSDGVPSIGQLLEAHLPGVTGPAASAAITSHSGLTYLMDIPADLLGTSAKDGGLEGDLITFKIGSRIVATGFWHSGTNVLLNIHPPQANPGASYSGNEGSPISFIGSANDLGGDATTYQWDWENDGTYDTTDQNTSHTFAQDGTFTVGLKVTDAQGGEGTGMVEVTVSNVAPTVNAGDDFTVAEDASFNFAGTATDPVDTLTYAWDFDYDGITFDVDATGSLTPSHAYAVVGDHTAALRVTDDDTSVIDTVVVTVTNVNDAPVITGQAPNPLPTDEDTTLVIALNNLLVTDPDNDYPDDFTLTILPGSQFTVSGDSITPAANYNGMLVVLVKVNDGLEYSASYPLIVEVRSVNDAPVANPQSLSTAEDTPLVIALTGSDIESSPLTYEMTVDPEHGTLSGTAPNLTYTPALDYNGADSFKFRVNDGDLNSVEATVSIDVTPVNDAPVITGQSPLSTDEYTELTILLSHLTVTDVDDSYPTGFSLTVQSGANYTVAGNAVRPIQNFHGALTVPVLVNDGDADSNIFNLTVTVIDLLPTNVDAYGPYTGIAGQAIVLNGTASCPSMDICTFAWDLDGDGGYDDAAVASPTYTWNTVGNYTIGLRVTDDDGNFDTDTASVEISGATHSLALVPGWNLVSFNVKPTSTAIATVLSSLNGNYDLVYAWDASTASNNWLKYSPSAPSYSNTLSTLNEEMGFWIHMTTADTLDVTGSIPGTTTISLSNVGGGWNLVGFPSSTDVDLPEALSDHGVGIDDFSLVYAYHANDADAWKLYDVDSPSWANDLDYLSPGWGYWVKVDVNNDWSVGY